ncbi:hypothetical protein FACS1894170_09650 [Planctomycetales bacterium]|nr:hypothetical protein FACS1894170_09650 [Planctomycetales bacterium]
MKNRTLSISFILAVLFSFTGWALCNEPDTATWDWKPTWLDKGDCGPNALYVLMNLEGKKVALAEVKKHLPFDPVKGCSLESMKTASDVLGFPVEVRFVKPSDVSQIPCPFILHGITSKEKHLGHFIVVINFDSQTRNYTLIDPVRETISRNPEASLLNNFSGYVLVPQRKTDRAWNILAGVFLLLAGIVSFGIVWRSAIKKRQHL